MSRMQDIENIIIGTLLCSTEEDNFYLSVKNSITADMFMDGANRRIFLMISEMNRNGMQKTNPYTVLMEYGEKCRDLCYRMCELSVDYSFVHRKCQYNERQFLIWAGYGINPSYTDVSFDDYVTRFIQNFYGNEKKCG